MYIVHYNVMSLVSIIWPYIKVCFSFYPTRIPVNQASLTLLSKVFVRPLLFPCVLLMRGEVNNCCFDLS